MDTILLKEGYLLSKLNNKKIIEDTKKELTVSPINFFELNTFIKKPPIKFPVYKETETHLIVPKFYGIKKFGKPKINNELEGLKIDINFNGKLRPKQEIIINQILPYLEQNNGGVLCLPCAEGKTVLSLYLISKFKVKTLVIVHKTFLLNQWKERAEEFTNGKLGIIQQNKVDIENKDIVIGMLQSIARDKYDINIFKDFGLVIFDEAHHAPSQYFSRALPIISCKLTIGLSATPKRNDGLEKVLYWYFGDIMYKSIVETNNIIQVNIINYDIKHEKFKEHLLSTGDINIPKTINKITSIGRRNKFIVNIIESILKENNRKIIILSDRVEHLKLLKTRLDNRNLTITTDFYIGGMKDIARKQAELAQVIFATYGMASEGLDIPDLNTLFLVTSRREIEQAVGRITRKINPEIRPLIFDFTDQLPCFVKQGYNRRKLYKKFGYEINIIDVINNEIINNKNLLEFNSIKPNEIENVNDICDFID